MRRQGSEASSRASASRALRVVRLWIAISVYLSSVGWLLALAGQLRAPGYVAALLAGLIGLVAYCWRDRGSTFQWKSWRFRKSLPRCFLVTLFLATLGAALYPPNNYDALTYRLPQILHWLAAGKWHWIAVSDHHINISPPGYGWFIAPVIALFHTDRLLALPNLVAFLLLPGLYFSVLRQCGVGGRVAWLWMWILPAASCFAMQAGSIGNDLLAAAYALAALALGFRAARQGSLVDFWLSAFAAALTTGVKITAAPLALPWLLVTLPCWRLVPQRRLISVAVAIVAILVSYIPTAIGNIRYTGSWNGDPTNELQLRIDSPLHAVVGNSLMILAGAVEPPICPIAGKVKERLQRFEASRFVAWLRQKYPRFSLSMGELPSEESSGLGLCVTLFAVVPCLSGCLSRGRRPLRASSVGRWVAISSWVALGVYLAKMGSEAAPRLAAPYYPLALLPLLRADGHAQFSRRPWWWMAAAGVALSIVPALILTPSRPLWPARWVLGRLAAAHPENALIARARTVYAVYAQRDNDVAPLKPLLPSDGRAIGYLRSGNDIEAPLWKPYGSREVVEVLPPLSDLSRFRGSVIIGSALACTENFHLTLEQFAQRVGGHIIGRATFPVKVSGGDQEWAVIAMDPVP